MAKKELAVGIDIGGTNTVSDLLTEKGISWLKTG